MKRMRTERKHWLFKENYEHLYYFEYYYHYNRHYYEKSSKTLGVKNSTNKNPQNQADKIFETKNVVA